jgi:hypothetical protein
MYKAMKLRTAAKLISCIGLIACLVGCAGYCILSLPEVMNLPFEWLYIIIDVAVMFVFVLVGVLLNLRANAIDRRNDMVGEEVEGVADENECSAECCATCPLADQCDYLAADDVLPAKEEAAPACECECEGECECECAEEAGLSFKYPAAIEKVREKLPAELGEKVDKIVDKAVVTVKENKATIATVAAAATATAVVIGAGKVTKARRQAANRRKFYEWLG